MLTLRTLPKREIFDLTNEPCPNEQALIDAIQEASTATLH